MRKLFVPGKASLQLAASGLLLAALSACGGGKSFDNGADNSSTTITGRVADGYIVGAIVFWDCNDNLRLDNGEISTTTGAAGAYTISSAQSVGCKLRAEIPSTAIDEDTNQAVGHSMTLAAIDGIPGFISPLTTIVALDGISQADLQKTLAGSTIPVSQDYIEIGDAGIQNHNAAKYISVALQSIGGQIKIEDLVARKELIKSVISKIPDIAFKTPTIVSQTELLKFSDEFLNFSKINPYSSFMGKAKYVINEKLLTGQNDLRRPVLQAALDAINKYPEISDGANITWKALPNAVQQTFAPQLADKSLFPKSDEEALMMEVLLEYTRKTVASIDAAHNNATREQNLQMIRTTLDASSTALQAALVIVPAASYVNGKAKFLLNPNKIIKLSKKVSSQMENSLIFAECNADAVYAMTYFSNLDTNGYDLEETVDFSKKLLACGMAVTKNSKYQAALTAISLGQNISASDSSSIRIMGDLADLISAALDAAQLSIPKSVWDMAVLYAVKSKIYELDAIETGDRTITAMQRAQEVVYQEFKKETAYLGESLIHARLKQYIKMVVSLCPVNTVLLGDACGSVESISPNTVNVGVNQRFSVNGTNLPTVNGLDITFNGCANIQFLSQSATQHQFTCTPTVAGTLTAVIRTLPGTTPLGSFPVAVSAATVLTPTSPNLLHGSSVSDSCFSCTSAYNGNPNSLTDGDVTTGRNVATFSGSFNVFLTTPKDIATLKLLPSMSPNGNVTFEVRTSTDASGAAGTWTTHGGPITRVWASDTWIDFTLNANTTGVRVLQVIVHSSPSWVAFYEIQGFAAGATQMSGSFLAASDAIGTDFTVPSGVTTCSFRGVGYWNYGPGPVDATGWGAVQNYPNTGNFTWPMPTAPAMSLIANTPSGYVYIGDGPKLAVTPNATLTFKMNDALTGYSDNSGSLNVPYSCQ